jgi:FkbM family methyltransferase
MERGKGVCTGQRRVEYNGVSYDIVQPNVSFPNFLFTVYSSGDIVSSYIKRTGVWDGAISNIMLHVLRFRNKTSTIIDFGANIGWFSVIAAADGHSSIAIEAMESNRLALELSLELNGLSPQVRVLPYALGSDASPKVICIAPRSPGNVGNGMLQSESEDICQEFTPIKTLDDIYFDENFHAAKQIDFLKAVCEGCEARAILGARRLFKENPPCSVFVEWRPDTMRQIGATDDPASAARILSQAGYIFFSVHATLDTGHNISLHEIPQERVESNLISSNADVFLLHKKCFSARDVKQLLVEIGRTAEKLNNLSRSQSYIW